jgi:hypothetical protein
MAKITIGEYDAAVEVATDLITEQEVDFTSAVTASVAFNARTRRIRICPDTACRFKIGDSVTALSTSQRLPAGAVEYHWVSQGRGWVISVIAE